MEGNPHHTRQPEPAAGSCGFASPDPRPFRLQRQFQELKNVRPLYWLSPSAYKTDSHYQAQIKPYMEYFAEADDKAEVFAFCQERMKADMTIEASRLKEMSRELSERLRRFGGTGAKQDALRQEVVTIFALHRIGSRLLRPSPGKWTWLWKKVED